MVEDNIPEIYGKAGSNIGILLNIKRGECMALALKRPHFTPRLSAVPLPLRAMILHLMNVSHNV